MNEQKVRFELVYATWDKLDQGTKAFFATLCNEDLVEGEIFYKTYFMKFNVIHEVFHTIGNKNDPGIGYYREEQRVNDLAVAYWREIGESNFINELEVKLKKILALMRNPVLEGEDSEAYFNDNYDALGSRPDIYGYYQFSFVLKAIEKKDCFIDALMLNVDKNVRPKTKEMKIIYGDVNTINTENVVNDCLKYIKLYNVNIPSIKMKNEYHSGLQFIESY